MLRPLKLRQMSFWFRLLLICLGLYYGSKVTPKILSPLEESLSKVPHLNLAARAPQKQNSASSSSEKLRHGASEVLIFGGFALFVWLGWCRLDRRAWTIYIPKAGMVTNEFLPLSFHSTLKQGQSAREQLQPKIQQGYLRRFNLTMAEMVTDLPQPVGTTISLNLDRLPGFPRSEAHCEATILSCRQIGTSGRWHSLTFRWQEPTSDVEAALSAYIAHHLT